MAEAGIDANSSMPSRRASQTSFMVRRRKADRLERLAFPVMNYKHNSKSQYPVVYFTKLHAERKALLVT